jgi:hypothetical protein
MRIKQLQRIRGLVECGTLETIYLHHSISNRTVNSERIATKALYQLQYSTLLRLLSGPLQP